MIIFAPEGISPGSNFINPREWFAGLAARTFNDAATAHTACYRCARNSGNDRPRERPEYALAWGLLSRVDAAIARAFFGKENLVDRKRDVNRLANSSSALHLNPVA